MAVVEVAMPALRVDPPESAWTGTEYQKSTYSSFDHMRRYALARPSRRSERAHASQASLLRPPVRARICGRGSPWRCRGARRSMPRRRTSRPPPGPPRRVSSPHRSDEWQHGVVPLLQVGEDAPLSLVEHGRRVLEVTPRPPVAQHAIVEPVRRDDPLVLDGLRTANEARPRAPVRSVTRVVRSTSFVRWRCIAGGT